MSMKGNLFLILAATSLCVACAPIDDETSDPQDEEEQVDEARQALAISNAEAMNGTVTNGTFINGIRQNGIRQNGIRQNGIRQNSNGLEGTDSESGVTVSGTGYAGATMEAVLGTSTVVELTINAVSTTDVPGLYTYEITSAGVNICGAAGAKAVLVPGRWNYVSASHVDDPELFTVACRGAAIAKCTEWGYRNWGNWVEDNGTSTQNVSLTHFQEACVRMVRADYCGDGVSHTENGTPIEIYDTAGLQTETPGNPLPLEAEWSATGAACVKHVRWTATAANPGQTVEDYITQNCLSRWAGPSSTSCGGSTSEYFTANGFKSSPTTYVAPLATRPLLRSHSNQHTH
jgi:ADYC domain